MIRLIRPTCPNPSALTRGDYKHRDNKRALKIAGSDKCMYCESCITHTYYGDVEHIIPKSVKPELEFEWDNLGYVCAACNGAKKDNFDENLQIVNPYVEDPSEYLFAAGAMVYSLQGNPRGQLTILDTKLNRSELVQRRQDLLDRIDRAVIACFNSKNTRLKEAALQQLKIEADSSKEYSLFVQSFLSKQGI